MDKYTGLLSKIRLLSEKPLLVRCTLITENEHINCLVAKDILARQIMMLPDDKYTLKVKGHFNKRHQLVIRELRVLNADQFTKELGI